MTSHDNDHERQIAKPSVPVMQMIGGKACWLKFGTNEYVHEPELEAIYMAAQHRPIPNLNQIVTGDARALAALTSFSGSIEPGPSPIQLAAL